MRIARDPASRSQLWPSRSMFNPYSKFFFFFWLKDSTKAVLMTKASYAESVFLPAPPLPHQSTHLYLWHISLILATWSCSWLSPPPRFHAPPQIITRRSLGSGVRLAQPLATAAVSCCCGGVQTQSDDLDFFFFPSLQTTFESHPPPSLLWCEHCARGSCRLWPCCQWVEMHQKKIW